MGNHQSLKECLIRGTRRATAIIRRIKPKTPDPPVQDLIEKNKRRIANTNWQPCPCVYSISFPLDAWSAFFFLRSLSFLSIFFSSSVSEPSPWAYRLSFNWAKYLGSIFFLGRFMRKDLGRCVDRTSLSGSAFLLMSFFDWIWESNWHDSGVNSARTIQAAANRLYKSEMKLKCFAGSLSSLLCICRHYDIHVCRFSVTPLHNFSMLGISWLPDMGTWLNWAWNSSCESLPSPQDFFHCSSRRFVPISFHLTFCPALSIAIYSHDWWKY